MSDDVGARAPRPHLGWHGRGYLPHFDAGAVVQTITFRLADSLPREFYEKVGAVSSNDKERFFLLEKGIDQGRGISIERRRAIVEIRLGARHQQGQSLKRPHLGA